MIFTLGINAPDGFKNYDIIIIFYTVGINNPERFKILTLEPPRWVNLPFLIFDLWKNWQWNWYSLTFPTLAIPVIWWNKKIRTSRDPAIQKPPTTAEKIGSVAYVELIFTDFSYIDYTCNLVK